MIAKNKGDGARGVVWAADYDATEMERGDDCKAETLESRWGGRGRGLSRLDRAVY